MTTIRTKVLLIAALAVSGCGNSGGDNGASSDPATNPADSQSGGIDIASLEAVEIVPGLSRKVIRDGTGAAAEPGQTAVVHYTGWLFDESAPGSRGAKFDSSLDRGAHFEFTLGQGRVIQGWDKGVVGMQVGEVRELTIAPEMAYGDRGAGALIPPGATLVFEVELADIKVPETAASDTQ
jgi:FKBP-type peptidyl-prolyl cis-trans isomerase FkpA